MYPYIILVLIVTADVSHVDNDVTVTTEEEITDRILEKLEKYEKRKRAQIGQKLTVNVSMEIFSIANIQQEIMQYSLEVFLRQTWQDDRLRHQSNNKDHLALDSDIGWFNFMFMFMFYYKFYFSVSKLWTPELFFADAANAHFHSVTRPNTLLRISSGGTVYLIMRPMVTQIQRPESFIQELSCLVIIIQLTCTVG